MKVKSILHCVQNDKGKYMQEGADGSGAVEFGPARTAAAFSRRRAVELAGDDLTAVPAPQAVLDREEKRAAKVVAAREKAKKDAAKEKEKAAKEKAKNKSGKKAGKKAQAVTA